MAAEIIMIVENKDACSFAPQAVEMRSREPADASAHDHKIVGLVGRSDLARTRPKIAIPQAVGGLETARVVPPQSGEDRRIVPGHILRRLLARKRCRDNSGNNPPAIAPPTAIGIPLRKSRRVMGTSAPKIVACRLVIIAVIERSHTVRRCCRGTG